MLPVILMYLVIPAFYTSDTILVSAISVHEATMENKLQEKCVQFGHSTPCMAAQVADSVKAKTLILFHVSPRYRPISIW